MVMACWFFQAILVSLKLVKVTKSSGLEIEIISKNRLYSIG